MDVDSKKARNTSRGARVRKDGEPPAPYGETNEQLKRIWGGRWSVEATQFKNGGF